MICCAAQGVLNAWTAAGFDKKDAGTLTSMTMVFIGVMLTAMQIYDNIAKFAGAGTLVPITGFANGVCACALEYQVEGQVFGIGCQIFKIAGPVILYGTAASVVYGIIYWITTLF